MMARSPGRPGRCADKLSKRPIIYTIRFDWWASANGYSQ